MFMGEYNHTIDPKNRLIVPAKFREGLGENFVISSGLDGCLYLTPANEWEKFTEQLMALPNTMEARQVQRHFLRNANECELDKQGRILVPQNLKDSVGLEKNILLIGVGKRVELWAEEKYETLACSESMEALVEKMSTIYGLNF